MSEYIYRPPPPPPPPAPSRSAATHNRGGYSNEQHGGFRGGQGGGRGGGRGGNPGGRGGRGRGERRPGVLYSRYSTTTQRSIPPEYYAPQEQPQRIPHILPRILQSCPQTPFSPGFLAQQPPMQFTPTPQQPQTNQFSNTPPVNPILNIPGFSLQTPPTSPQLQPPPPQPLVQLSTPYFTYAQEQHSAQVPQIQQPQRPRQAQGSPSTVQNNFYTDTSSGWPTQSSYGYFELPQQPAAPRLAPSRKQRSDGRPDMDEETWLGLNGGKLLGTNIAPPETPEEIEAWIKERKTRFPTAKKIAEYKERKAAEQEALKKALAESQSCYGLSTSEEQELIPPQDVQARKEAPKEVSPKSSSFGPKKRKRLSTDKDDALLMGSDIAADTDSSSSDTDPDNAAPPEAVSVKTKVTLPDAPTTGRKYEPKPKRLAHICRDFAARRKCPRGDECRFRHEMREELKRKEKRAGNDDKKTLYQRLVEHDREKQNVLVLQVIKYLIDKGKLQGEDLKG